MIRTSWVYGPGKNSFQATVVEKLRRGQRVQAITDTWASCTYVADLVERVLAMVERADFGTYHVVDEGVCSYETFAREAIAPYRVNFPSSSIADSAATFFTVPSGK